MVSPHKMKRRKDRKVCEPLAFYLSSSDILPQLLCGHSFRNHTVLYRMMPCLWLCDSPCMVLFLTLKWVSIKQLESFNWSMFCYSTQNVIISSLLWCNSSPIQSNGTDVMGVICPNSIFLLTWLAWMSLLLLKTAFSYRRLGRFVIYKCVQGSLGRFMTSG